MRRIKFTRRSWFAGSCFYWPDLSFHMKLEW